MFLLSTTLFYSLHNFTISKEKGADKKWESPRNIACVEKEKRIIYYILKVLIYRLIIT